MGYVTEYNGIISLNKNNFQKIKVILTYLQSLANNCGYVASNQSGKSIYWFHPCDSWIAYLPEFKFKSFGIFIDSSQKHYENSVEIFLLLISLIDKKAKGEIDWFGEDENDSGTLKVENGKVFCNEKEIKYEGLSSFPELFTNEKIAYKNPKFDFINSIKNNNLNLSKIRRQVVLGAI